jgi:hypothetical protein
MLLHFIKMLVLLQVGKTTLYDMEVDATSKHVLTACQDRNIRVYTVANGKHSRTFKGSNSDDGTLIKVALDRSDKILIILLFHSSFPNVSTNLQYKICHLVHRVI